MKYLTPDDKAKLKVGQILYACSYSSYTHTSLSQKPIQGMIVSSYCEDIHENRLKHDMADPCYFVPFDNTGQIMWDQAIHYNIRDYADTKEECIELYNDIIHRLIQYHETELQHLTNDIIKSPNIEEQQT